MKKQLGMVLLTSSILHMSACTSAESEAKPIESKEHVQKDIQKQVQEGDFVFNVVSKKATYLQGEKPDIYAELAYTGNEKGVTISYGYSPITFTKLEETTRGYKFRPAIPLPLSMGVPFKKEKPFHKTFHPFAGYSPDDSKEKINFAKQIAKGSMPKGHYILHAEAQFSVEKGAKQLSKPLSTVISFDVK
ncbi:hypothetical protein [Priestia koreensis]|uniref:hypothetical protein n=1 Tax=Priestia koreensis TaxID=284581 RepID=UPI00203C5D3C|nr:hypothetical protein [Priestia koreensis]MCM3005427.1 hypothetical protein [Priestia koreensis]